MIFRNLQQVANVYSGTILKHDKNHLSILFKRNSGIIIFPQTKTYFIFPFQSSICPNVIIHWMFSEEQQLHS